MIYAHYEFKKRFERYCEEITPQSRVDLQSSMAFFEQYLLPLIIAQRAPQVPLVEKVEVLTIVVDGRWGAYEFRQLFHGLDYLNKVYTIRYKLERDSPDFRLGRGMTRSPVYHRARLYYYLAPHEELRVRQIRFASPGLVSFEGIGDVMKELREFLDYIITAEWMKRFIDNYYWIRDKELRSAERQARLAEAGVRIAEANAQRREAVYREIEANSKIRKAIRETRQRESGLRLEQIEPGLRKLEEISGVAIRLEVDKLARLDIVEDSIMQSVSELYRLGSEQQKIKPGIPSPEQ